ISHRGRDFILEKLPRMYKQFKAFQGLDISTSPVEVAPTAHYSMGGIAVEPETHATDVPGLFAAGECASGLHGANRLGGNSLVDILVFGRRAGEAAAAHAMSNARRGHAERAIGEALGSPDARTGLITARATIRCAIERRETRGAHNRSDFPSVDEHLERNFFVRRSGDVESGPVPDVPSELTAWASGAPMCPGPERLLE